jgi:hypothetical protein
MMIRRNKLKKHREKPASVATTIHLESHMKSPRIEAKTL